MARITAHNACHCVSFHSLRPYTERCTVRPSTKMTMASEETLVARASAAKSWSVLANGRLGLEMPPMPGGKQVYLSTNLKTRLCEHGETASLILQWCAKQLTRPATTKCTCLNVDGLTAGRFSIPPKDWVGPPRYYDVLVSSGSEELILPGGRAARRLLHMDGAYMLANGTNSTTHTNTQVTSSACAHTNTHTNTPQPPPTQVIFDVVMATPRARCVQSTSQRLLARRATPGTRVDAGWGPSRGVPLDFRL